MQKIQAGTPDLTDKKIEKIGKLFPNVITEKEDKNGNTVKAIDFELLKQELSKQIVDDDNERYRLDWPGKKRSLLKANTPIDKTLRPVREDSVNFDTTENLYIEGDNFEALKILQESYLGKVKMIYIDPPYNTGKDFVYKDNFKKSKADYEEELDITDDEGGKLIKNTDTNGRFHSDWLSMMYERLLIARDLLKDDGVIFMSIDDNEVHNLRKIADEVFGEENFVNAFIVRRRVKSLNIQFSNEGLSSFNIGFEYMLCYSKTGMQLFKAIRKMKKNPPKKGSWNVFWSGADRPTMRYELLGFTPESGQWRWSKEKASKAIDNYDEYLEKHSNELSLEDYWKKTGEKLKFIRRIENGTGKNGGVQYWIAPKSTTLRSTNWLDIEVSEIHKEINLPFDNPKNKHLVKTILESSLTENDLVLDFFSGSATTAHAVMQLNAEDGGNRKFIMVQIPEETEESSEAYKAGYKYITDIGKERIRRAAKKIQDDYKNELAKRETPLDTGFRVFKVDSTNLEDVTRHPSEVKQEQLLDLVDNIKSDRTPEDLLVEVMLNSGLELSLPIVRKEINYKTVFFVAENSLVACFDKDVDEALIEEIADIKPLKVVLRDASFKDDKDRINFENRFKSLSPDTVVSVI